MTNRRPTTAQTHGIYDRAIDVYPDSGGMIARMISGIQAMPAVAALREDAAGYAGAGG